MALSGPISGSITVDLTSLGLGIPIGADQVITFTTDYPNNDRTYLGVYYRSGIEVSPLSITLDNAVPNGSITITPFAPGPYIIPYTISSAFTPHCGEYTGFIDVLVRQDCSGLTVSTVRVGGSFGFDGFDTIDSDSVTIVSGPTQPGRDLHMAGNFTLLRCAFKDLVSGFYLTNPNGTGSITVTEDADYIYVDYDVTIVNGTWPALPWAGYGSIAVATANTTDRCAEDPYCLDTNCALSIPNIGVSRNIVGSNTVFTLRIYLLCFSP